MTVPASVTSVPRTPAMKHPNTQIHEHPNSRHPNSPTPKIHFLLGFRPLYFENVRLFKMFIRVKKVV